MYNNNKTVHLIIDICHVLYRGCSIKRVGYCTWEFFVVGNERHLLDRDINTLHTTNVMDEL